jgi:hypothetical protein
VWFKNEKKSWYEKGPNTVTDEELNKLVIDFNRKLRSYDKIWFYFNPGRFRKLYRKLLNKTELKVNKFTHLWEIPLLMSIYGYR